MKRALVLADKNTWKIQPDEVARLAESCDLIISLGDLTSHDLRPFANTEAPKLGVYGNHCRGEYLALVGFVDLHMK